ncbi:hypothetical protein HHI36_008005 [Cryptolaemus montrouzieri]|uniref:Uncharacterized protein n=1 Tax=Cryptolaemus montrouzieri TaxID=559131 RepID=A0ABD2MRE3_9CUCU
MKQHGENADLTDELSEISDRLDKQQRRALYLKQEFIEAEKILTDKLLDESSEKEKLVKKLTESDSRNHMTPKIFVNKATQTTRNQTLTKESCSQTEKQKTGNENANIAKK